MRIEVTAMPEQGFYRAGSYWPHQPTEADVEPEVVERLEAEPKLKVRRLDGSATVYHGRQSGSRGSGEGGESTPLPEDFPCRDKLIEAGFASFESLQGVTHPQLVAAKLAAKDSKTVRELVEAHFAAGTSEE